MIPQDLVDLAAQIKMWKMWDVGRRCESYLLLQYVGLYQWCDHLLPTDPLSWQLGQTEGLTGTKYSNYLFQLL